MLLRVVDFETTGPVGSEVIEIGLVDVEGRGLDWDIRDPRTILLKPTDTVPPGARAVHHISDRDLSAASPTSQSAVEAFILGEQTVDHYVAHHAAFERSFLGELGDASWICTAKAARRAWPQAPGFSNQVLRYWLQLDLDPSRGLPAHRAGPDAFVTAHILVQLLQTETINELVAWTTQPEVVRFGRHRGRAWSEVPSDYLRWLVEESDMDASRLRPAKAELEARSASFVEMAPVVA
jgi:exodeoxyribonuclease X